MSNESELTDQYLTELRYRRDTFGPSRALHNQAKAISRALTESRLNALKIHRRLQEAGT